MTTVADAIRTKAGGSDPLSFPSGFVSAVEGITTGGGDDLSVVMALLSPYLVTSYKNYDVNPGWAEPMALTDQTWEALRLLFNDDTISFGIPATGGGVTSASILSSIPVISSLDIGVYNRNYQFAKIKTYGYVRDYTRYTEGLIVKEIVDGDITLRKTRTDAYFLIPTGSFYGATLARFPTMIDNDVSSNGYLYFEDSAFNGVKFNEEVVDLSNWKINTSSGSFTNNSRITYSVDSEGKLVTEYGPVTYKIGEIQNTYASYAMFGNTEYPVTIIETEPTPPTIPSSLISLQGTAKIIVPAGSLQAYQEATNWAQFADIMVEASA